MKGLGFEDTLRQQPRDFHLAMFEKLLDLQVIVLGGHEYSDPPKLDELDDDPGTSHTLHVDRLATIIQKGAAQSDVLNAYLRAPVEPDDDAVCYAMPPCGFDRIPVYLLEFAHKLRKSTAPPVVFDYEASGTGVGPVPAVVVPAMGRVPARPVATPDNALRALVDVALCWQIYKNDDRFFGTCHGAQAMWLAMGQRLTRMSRVANSALEGSTAHQLDTTKMTISIERGGIKSLAPMSQHGTVTVSRDDLTTEYSSDFNHEHLMLLPNGGLVGGWTQQHVLSGLVFPNQVAILADPTDRASRKLLKKKGDFCQAFAVGKLRGFQDHPHYHVVAASESQSGGDVANNTKYKEASAIVNQVWR
jgi:hypothetical protein